MKKILILATLLLGTSCFAQESKSDSYLFERALATARTGGDWKETEWGILYYEQLDKLEKEYSGRLSGDVFKQKRAVLDRNWHISSLKAAEQSYKDEQFRQFTKNASLKLRTPRTLAYLEDSLRISKDPQVVKVDSLHHELAVNRTANRIKLHQEYWAAKDSLYRRILRMMKESYE